MAKNAGSFIDNLLNEIADRVIRKISENNSNWLNTIQYKVRAENIEGQIQASQIDGIEDMVADAITGKVSDIATAAAEEYINDLSFEVRVK